MERIGLFPLNLVLFPESVIPLHIYEDKYKKLIRKCIQDNSVFGINLMASSKIQDVGCAASIADVIKEYGDGRLDILVAGIKRYRLLHYEEGEDQYFEADIEYFDDDDKPVNESMLNECIDIYNQIADAVQTINIAKLDTSVLATEKPSFLIAQKSGLTDAQKQKLLELTTENDRLVILLRHLKRILPMLKENEVITKIVQNDGYYRP